MSTHRTRNQQRREQSGGADHAQPAPTTPAAAPKTFVKGIVIPIIINFVVCVGLCIGKVMINKHTSVKLPARIIPLLILISFLIAILIVVSYVIKQYKYLKGTYQSLEQGMAAAAVLNAQQGDFVEYPVGSPYYGNNTMYNQYNQYNQIPQTVPSAPVNTNTNPPAPKKNLGCGISFFTIIIVTMVFGLYAYMSFPRNMDFTNLDLTSGIVTNVNKEVYEEDEDTYTEYVVSYKYSYNGEEYTGSDRIKFSVNKNDDIDIIVDAGNPENSFLAADVAYILLVWIGSIILLGILGLIMGARKK